MKKVISFTDRLTEMVEEIQEAKGYTTFTSVVHQAIIDLHTRTFPAYLKSPKAAESPEDRVRRKAEEKKAKEEGVREEKLEIAKALKGKVVSEAGNEFCVYYTYTGKKRYEQKIPLMLLTTDVLKNQYHPSKEKVEQYQKEGKTDY